MFCQSVDVFVIRTCLPIVHVYLEFNMLIYDNCETGLRIRECKLVNEILVMVQPMQRGKPDT